VSIQPCGGTVKVAFLSLVAAGDTFQLLPGCDRTIAAFTNVFNNAIRSAAFRTSRHRRPQYEQSTLRTFPTDDRIAEKYQGRHLSICV
jgi:hypothetical protein